MPTDGSVCIACMMSRPKQADAMTTRERPVMLLMVLLCFDQLIVACLISLFCEYRNSPIIAY